MVRDVNVSFDKRETESIVHIIQYDDVLPVIAVHLWNNSSPYNIPDGAAVNVRLCKADKTYVYNPSLGVSEDRNTAYIEVTAQMAAADGLAIAIIEVVNSGIAGTGVFVLDVGKNPVPDDVIQSTDEYKALYEYARETEELARAAADSERLAGEHETAAGQYAADAGESAGAAAGSAQAAGEHEQGAKTAEEAAGDYATMAKSYAVGDTGSRDGEESDNAKYYSQQAATDRAAAEAAAAKLGKYVSSVNGQTGDVVIGGVNLFQGTQDFSSDKWVYFGNHQLDGDFQGFTVSRFDGSWCSSTQNIPAKIGETYTLSAYIKAESGSSIICYTGEKEKNTSTVPYAVGFGDIGEEWKRYSVSFVVAEDCNLQPRFENSERNKKLWVCGIKLERGNAATDWSPATVDYLGPENIWTITNMHRNIFRGKNLGSTFTDAQKAAIAAGTFDDLYVGDYWVMNGRTWRIADFDYWVYRGVSGMPNNPPHIVIVPDDILYEAKMNNEDITEGGYYNSIMRTENLAQAKEMIETDFGAGTILKHKGYLVNGVKDGKSSSCIMTEVEVELMNEAMVYGAPMCLINAASISAVNTTDFSQLALFQIAPTFLNIYKKEIWLRDVVSGTDFAMLRSNGYCGSNPSSQNRGVRPAVGIVGA